MKRTPTALLATLLACESPTDPATQLVTGVGTLEVSGPADALPAVLDGVDGDQMCLERAVQELGRPPEAFAGVLDGWRVQARGRESWIQPEKRLIQVATGHEAARYGMRHECLTALAIVLGTCREHWRQVEECGAFGPGYTVACQPC